MSHFFSAVNGNLLIFKFLVVECISCNSTTSDDGPTSYDLKERLGHRFKFSNKFVLQRMKWLVPRTGVSSGIWVV